MAIGRTRLDAVNTMLTAIGETPVNSLSGSGLLEVAVAQQVLDETQEAVQSRGWYFNTEAEVTMTPTFPEKEIRLGADVLSITPAGGCIGRNFVQRGARLFDLDTNSYEFSGAICVTVVRLLPFDDMPAQAKRYVTMAAARMFQDRIQGSTDANRLQMQDEAKAWADLLLYDARARQLNMGHSPSTQAILIRRR